VGEESQRRQCALVEAARSMGFANVTTIEDELGVRAPFLQVSEQGREEGWSPRAARTREVS
jgi:hypothetical protein